MPTNLAECAELLTQAGLRHHLDADEGVVWVVFVTRGYENPRGERLAVVAIEAPDAGRRCRTSIARAFVVEGDPAAACLACCRLAADTPLVGVECEADAGRLRLVVETAIEDGRLTRRQLLSMIERLVDAAEAWHGVLSLAACLRPAEDRRAAPGAA